MAMIYIRKGKDRIKVSENVYKNIFKRMGFRPEKSNVQDSGARWEDQSKESEMDVPISDMTKEQLRVFAEKHGIDTSSAHNLKEARDIVRKAIREAKM